MSFLGAFRSPPAEQILDKQRAYALEQARKTLPELQRRDLTRGPFGSVTHGHKEYRIVRGHIADPRFSPATAFYVTEEGLAVYLEPLP